MKTVVRVGVVCAVLLGFAPQAHAAIALNYVAADKAVAPGARAVVKVPCPRDEHVVGGGASSTDDHSTLIGSYPFDGKDKDNIPDDGWKVVTRSGASVDTTLAVYATCESEGSQLFYFKGSAPLTAFGAGTASLLCPPGMSVVGGGGLAGGKHSFMDQSLNIDKVDSDPDTDPDDGWVAGMVNLGSKPTKVKVWEICRGGSETYEYKSVPGSAVHDDETIAHASCSSGNSIVSGGYAAVIQDGVYARGAAPSSLSNEFELVVDNFTQDNANTTTNAICLIP